MAEKRYYWLKLQDDFFSSKRIKKLRNLAGGDTYTIIYLKMQLLAMKSNGVLEYTGLEPSFAEELALDLDEKADNVSVTVNYLLSCGLLETVDNREYIVPYAVLNTGSEGSSAKRMRELRGRQASLSDNTSVTMCAQRYGEIEKREDKEKEKSKEGDMEPAAPAPAKPTRHKYGQYQNVLLSDKDMEKLKTEFSDWQERIERLSEYMASTGKSYKDHLATIRSWARKDKAEKKAEPERRKTFSEIVAEASGKA